MFFPSPPNFFIILQLCLDAKWTLPPPNWIIKNCSKNESQAGTSSLQKSTVKKVQAEDSLFYQHTPALMLPALIQCLFWGEEAALFYLLIHPIYLSLYLKGDLTGGLKRLVTFYKGNIWWNCSFISFKEQTSQEALEGKWNTSESAVFWNVLVKQQ